MGDLDFKITKARRAGGKAQAVELLPCKHEDLRSKFSTKGAKKEPCQNPE
jgi:hypothetical protein